MKRFLRPSLSALMMAGAFAAVGCSDQTATPLAPTARTVRADETAAPAQHLVMFKGNGIPSDFESSVAALGGTVAFSHEGAGFAVVSGLSEDAAAQLRANGNVADVQSDVDVAVSRPANDVYADISDEAMSQTNPTTAARYVWQWNMRSIGANKAWAAGKLGSSDVTVAILDSGIDYNVADLNGLVDLSRSTSFIPGDNAITARYFPTRNNITDYNGHGTNVANQVSSKGVALAGVTSKTTLIGVKVLGANGSGPLSAILNGVLWAADHGADVANMSLGGGFSKAGNGRFVGLINRIFNYANRKGMLIVVAAGNDSENLDANGNMLSTYCDSPHVVCVSAFGPATATGDVNTPSFYTNFGRSSISVAGPGGNADAAHGFAASAWPWGNDVASWVWSYCSKTTLAGFTAAGVPVLAGCQGGNRLTGEIGTSQASPHVAGLAALLIAEKGHGNPSQIKNAIMKSADGQGNDPYFGRGRINVARALGL
ncbi:MAG: S8 family serine peptidase [Gemmatimonadetes bacterium]|nr:S8 family serine peptidase [Gemmatimonadota bacterium]